MSGKSKTDLGYIGLPHLYLYLRSSVAIVAWLKTMQISFSFYEYGIDPVREKWRIFRVFASGNYRSSLWMMVLLAS